MQAYVVPVSVGGRSRFGENRRARTVIIALGAAMAM
jgi:hypothetical protein